MHSTQSEKEGNPTKTVLLRLGHYMMQHRLKVFIVAIAVIASTSLTVYAPTLLGQIVDRYIVKKDISGTMEHLFYLASIYLTVSLLTWVQTYYMIQISVGVVRTLRYELFEKFQVLPIRYFNNHPPGDLMSRLTNDLDNLSTALTQNSVQLIASTLTVLGTMIAMFLLSFKLACISFLILPLMFYASKKIIQSSSKYYIERQKELGSMNAHMNDHILGAEVVKVFGQEKEQWHIFNERNQQYKKADFKAEAISNTLAPTNSFLNNVGLAFIIGVGAIMTVQGAATIGTIASFSAYSRQFFRPIEQLSTALNALQAAYAGLKRVFEVLDEPNEFEEDGHKRDLSHIEGEIRLKDVFLYDEQQKPILNGISLTIQCGQCIAIIGPSGSGKTSLLNVLNGFDIAQKGDVILNNQPIHHYKISDLRKRMSSVSQEVYLFTGSIADNIRFSNPKATDEEVMEAAKKAQAHDFIEKLPERYQTMLYSNGDNISEGERQLLAIARAILANSDVLILDETMSFLNVRMKRNIQKQLQQSTQTKTIVMVTHQLELLKDVDYIFVMKDGEIVEQGTHLTLMQRNRLYRKLHET